MYSSFPQKSHVVKTNSLETVQQAGGSVSIRVRLTEVLREERNLWEQTYDRAMTDVFLIHSDVTRAIAREIKVKLGHDSLPLRVVSCPVRTHG